VGASHTQESTLIGVTYQIDLIELASVRFVHGRAVIAEMSWRRLKNFAAKKF